MPWPLTRPTPPRATSPPARGSGAPAWRRWPGPARWTLGVAAPGERMDGGTQLALPLDLPAAPRLRELSDWESLLADYGTTGVTLGTHALELLRPSLPDAVTSA